MENDCQQTDVRANWRHRQEVSSGTSTGIVIRRIFSSLAAFLVGRSLFSSSTVPSRAQRVLRPGDTIVGTVRPGNGSYAYVSADGLTGSTGFAVLRPKQRILQEVVYLAATGKENIEHLARLADGGAYPAVRPELVAATKLTVAPENMFSAFSAATGGLIDRAEANKCESRTLAATRDLLLPKLMSGEIRVKDAEALVGEVA